MSNTTTMSKNPYCRVTIHLLETLTNELLSVVVFCFRISSCFVYCFVLILVWIYIYRKWDVGASKFFGRKLFCEGGNHLCGVL